jgi:hypothetical protein
MAGGFDHLLPGQGDMAARLEPVGEGNGLADGEGHLRVLEQPGTGDAYLLHLQLHFGILVAGRLAGPRLPGIGLRLGRSQLGMAVEGP